MAAVISSIESERPVAGHAAWLRASHWVLAASVLTLAFSGFVILMAHPRLYWGKTGNDLTPAVLELPIGRNYKHGGWGPATTFFPGTQAVVTAPRTYEIFNQNGWARSLHFLAVWFLLAASGVYLLGGLLSGHLWRDIIPRREDFGPRGLWRDIRAHMRWPLPRASGGPPYGPLQKLTYALVVLLVLPLMVLTGLTMSPAVTAAVPGLLDLFGGSQSARTIHFFSFSLLVLFFIIHLAMVVLTGFKRQIRAMTLGG